MRSPQPSAGPALREHRHRLELPPGHPTERHAQPHRPEAGVTLPEPADQVVIAARRCGAVQVRPYLDRHTLGQRVEHAADADTLDEIAQPRLVALLARPFVAKQVQQRTRDIHHLVRAHQHGQQPRQARVRSLGAADEHLKEGVAAGAAGEKADVLRPEMQRVVGRAVQADVELTRQVGVVAVADEQRRHGAAQPSSIDQLVGEHTAERVSENVADVVVAGLLRGQPDGGQPVGHRRHVANREPLHLEVCTRRHVYDAVAVVVGDGRHLPRLRRGQLAGRNPDPIHVAARFVPLAVEEAVPLHPLQVRGGNLLHRRPSRGVPEHVGPDVEPVLLRLPDLGGVGHRVALSLPRATGC